MNNTTSKDRASTVSDWEEYYDSRGDVSEYRHVDTEDFRNLSHKILIETIEKHIGLQKGEALDSSVIEIGAGESDLLINVCRSFNPKEVYGLDYLESACSRLSIKAKIADADIKVICADMFSPPSELKGKFDFVMSYGVVEHFNDLKNVMRSIAAFSKDDGTIFTLIPNNKNTIYGWLMKQWNIDVYNAHVMYDIDDLKVAHKEAGLEIIWCEHVVSSNFGMLSWCFKYHHHGVSYWLYKQLTRVSKLVWFFESKLGLLKPLRVFAPYIICVSKPVR